MSPGSTSFPWSPGPVESAGASFIRFLGFCHSVFHAVGRGRAGLCPLCPSSCIHSPARPAAPSPPQPRAAEIPPLVTAIPLAQVAASPRAARPRRSPGKAVTALPPRSPLCAEGLDRISGARGCRRGVGGDVFARDVDSIYYLCRSSPRERRWLGTMPPRMPA